MKFSNISSAQNHLLKAHLISVETDISNGLHAFSIVGLPDKAIEEARDRVSAAIKNSGFKSPKQTNAKVVVSLAPADIKKEGPLFDLPIALGYLLAAGEMDFDPSDKLFVGELALDGTLRPIRGVLSFARLAAEKGYKEIYVPKDNAAEAALIVDIDVYGVERLDEIVVHLVGAKTFQKTEPVDIATLVVDKNKDGGYGTDLDDVAGQDGAKRGLVIAAAGRHNIGLFGPPGTGKTLLARALASIMPALSFEDMLEATEIHSVAGILEDAIITRPPVRSPHHTSSYTALIGGGTPPRPGEITLAHKGILFMDEFSEFERRAVESLRQPLEDRAISISRSKGSAKFPADFVLVAALNPCACGNKGIQGKECLCSPKEIARYGRKISGPIMDRIDMWIEVSKVEYGSLMKNRGGRKETDIARADVEKARRIQKQRFARLGIDIASNSSIHARDLSRAVELSSDAESVLNRAATAYDLSGRGYHRTVKLARTVADLAESEKIEAPHILEALQYRQRGIM